MDLCRTIMSANMPLNKSQNTEFRNVTFGKFYLDDCYKEMMKKIGQRVLSKIYWISINKTTEPSII